MIYGLMADIHAHAWSAFSTMDEQARNSRLMAICHEIERCASATASAGGGTVIIAGDLFHVRGSVDPEVFNPVKDTLQRVAMAYNVKFLGIPGNHDLAAKDSMELGSSVAMIASNEVAFHHENYLGDFRRFPVAMIPWQRDVATLLDKIAHMAEFLDDKAKLYDLIIHRGIDGTLTDVPAKGLTAEKLASYGFRRVFAGDYHHHKDFGSGVYSIGALTHQTWSDVGTKAGFLVVHPNRVDWHCSHAPHFVDITEADDAAEIPLLVDGQFVRARIGEATAGDITEMRAMLMRAGAKGVLINSIPKTTAEKREGVTAKALDSLDKSVTSYVAERGHNARVAAICGEIMKEVTA